MEQHWVGRVSVSLGAGVLQTNRLVKVSSFIIWPLQFGLNVFDSDQCINIQTQADPNQWNGAAGYYGYAQGYENYGYAPATTQDPNMYGSYPGYPNYQPQQQQQPQPQGGYS